MNPVKRNLQAAALTALMVGFSVFFAVAPDRWLLWLSIGLAFAGLVGAVIGTFFTIRSLLA